MRRPKANEGYFQQPSIHGDRVAFVCEGSLWTASIRTGEARRLIDWPGEIIFPHFSPDGSLIAFTSTREGTPNLYCVPAGGGEAKRLTYHNLRTTGVGWTPDGTSVLFRSPMASPTPRECRIFAAEVKSGRVRELPVGPAMTLALHRDGRRAVIGRNTFDPARWKRYRGGLCGVLWHGDLKTRRFRKLIELKGNVVSPMWIGNRVCFLSDHEDHGNIYSSAPDGKELRRHTHHADYYVRYPSTDGKRIVYQKGADIWLCVPGKSDRRLSIRIGSTRPETARRFVDAARFLGSYELHSDGNSVLLTSRGKLLHMPNWEGAPRQMGARQGVRYRLAAWLADKRRVLTLSDESGEEGLEIWDSRTGRRTAALGNAGFGFLWDLEPSPKKDIAALANDRFRLYLLDLKKNKLELIDKSEVDDIRGMTWSPDGRFLAYTRPERQAGEMGFHSAIWVYDTKSRRKRSISGPEFFDYSPTFDPEGRFLAFLSNRYLNPVLDSMELNSSFPTSTKPYMVMLKASDYSPLFPMPKKEAKDRKEDGKKKEKKKELKVEIDFEGIRDRIEEVPVREGDYDCLTAIKGKLLFLSEAVTGLRGTEGWFDEKEGSSLECYDLEKRKLESLYPGVSDYSVARGGEKAAVRIEKRLRVIKAGEKPPEGKPGEEDAAHPDTGWLNLDRLRLEIEPAREWRQIYYEAWRNQRDFFWDKGFSGVDWPDVRKRYERLLPKVATRAELSDLIWDMQGELGTSHAYELGGDYSAPPTYEIGLLGADLELDRGSGYHRVRRIYRGDPWMTGHGSPLLASGVRVREGDYILAVDGIDAKHPVHPYSLTVNRVGTEVTLSVGRRPVPAKAREVVVRTIGNELPCRYRDWVSANREHVSKRSGGRLGYIHIPDMGCRGLIEFHRGLYTESRKDGLIVDVRFNGGGFVSGIVITKLLRRPVAYFRRRGGRPNTYPEHSVRGPMVAVCDERAGSDGDIFCQTFKALKLGVLVGKRTWGGVIGIWARRRFVDSGMATQPEFPFWFADKGWEVENYGVEPHVEVELDPASFAAGRDPQLDKAVEVALEQLKKRPVKPPELGPSPDKSPRKLPTRKKRKIR